MTVNEVCDVDPGRIADCGRAIERDILYFKSPSSNDFSLDGLVASGWLPCIFEEPLEAEELARSRGISVGLIAFGPCCGASQRNEIEELLAESSLTWIALVPEQCEDDAKCWCLIESGFFDYLRYPIDPQRLSIILGHADGMAHLSRRIASWRKSLFSEDAMIGSSPVMQQVSRKLSKIASVDAPVLITGETGTGKELAARAIHNQSNRAQAPFEAVNCGALPPNLIQTELFGHEKGSFTGAHDRRIGRFEAADGGTIFLDEIGDLPPDLQVNLLRILDERKLRRVGGTKDIPIDVRVLAATHVDLETAVEDGLFRRDLYYRLNVLRMYLPALRERGNDVEILAEHFLQESGKRLKKDGLRFTQSALVVIRDHNWRGNVRELINCVERAVVMTENKLITPSDLGIERRKTPRTPLTLEAARANAEKRAVISALYRTGRNLAHAARELDISRVTVYRLIDKYKIEI